MTFAITKAPAKTPPCLNAKGLFLRGWYPTAANHGSSCWINPISNRSSQLR
ncbi:predicted protein [Botrytis cinerea T4]|uniref:Uncharacterized protein n=1 Tax=Botryotinia fuckeliana (strain T4) TaxID=999810 RepID=G2Y8F5_BOTF4|nr:predicted protein [Botrytis cinerea T4]